MAIPNVILTEQSGGVGIIVPGVGALPVNIAGWCSSGPGATPTAIGVGALSTLTGTFGVGSAVDLAASILANGAPNGIIFTRIYDGVVSAWTRTGGSVGVFTDESSAPLSPYGTATATGSTGAIVQCSTAGALGTAQFIVSYDGGVTWSTPITSSAAWSSAPYWTIPGGPNGTSGLVVSVSAASYTAGTIFTGAITSSVGYSYTVVSGVLTRMTAASTVCQQFPAPGSSLVGEGAVTMDTTSNPQDAYNVIVLIETSGVIGVGQFSYSLDGGLTFSNNIQIPSGGGPTALGTTGIQLDWANTGGAGSTTSGFIAGESYLFTTIPPAITAADVLNVGESITGNANQWDWMHVVGRPTTSSGNQPSISAATGIFSNLATIGTYWFSLQRYSFLVEDAPPCTNTNNTAAALVTAFANLASDFVSVGAGDCNVVSALTGAEVARPASWAASIWGSTLPIWPLHRWAISRSSLSCCGTRT